MQYPSAITALPHFFSESLGSGAAYEGVTLSAFVVDFISRHLVFSYVRTVPSIHPPEKT